MNDAQDAVPFAFETVKARYGRITIFRNDTILGPAVRAYGEWAENEIRFIKSLIQDGDTVVDVGAYIGTHTLAFAQFVGRQGHVVSIEPRPENFEILAKNVKDNEIKNVRLELAAAADRLGAIDIPSLDVSQQMNFGGLGLDLRPPSSEGHDGHPQRDLVSSSSTTVRVLTVDSLGLDACALLKIDVENIEDLVILGATKTINTYSPIIYVELNTVESGIKILDALHVLGYLTYVHVVNAFNKDNFLSVGNNIFGNDRESAILAVPRTGLRSARPASSSSSEFLLPVNNADDLVFCLLQKSQYFRLVLQNSSPGREFMQQYGSFGDPMDTIAEKTAQIDAASSQIDALEDAVAKKDLQIDALEDTVAKKDLQIAEVHGTLADAQRRTSALLTRNSEDHIRQLTLLKRADYDGRVPRSLTGLRLMNPWRRKDLRRLASDYRLISGSALFDSRWYLSTYPDVASQAADPALHYLLHGAKEGRAPGPNFDSGSYLKSNPDVARSRVNPLVHFLLHGAAEGRIHTKGSEGYNPLAISPLKACSPASIRRTA